MSFNLVSIDHDGVVHVALSGDLDHDPASGRENPLAHCLGQAWASNRVMLDMDKAEYLNSTALGWLLQSQKAFDHAGGRLVLHSVPPSIAQVIRMMRIDKVLTLTSDAASARAAILAGSGDGGTGNAPGSGGGGSGGGGDHTHDA